MSQERGRTGMRQERESQPTGARSSAPSIPPGDAPDSSGPTRSRADSSHRARRRFVSAPALDIEIDDLDFYDAPPGPSLAVTQPTGKPPESARSRSRGANARRAPTAKGRWRLTWPVFLGLALFAIAVGSAAGLIARARDAHRRAQAARAAEAAAPSLPSAAVTGAGTGTGTGTDTGTGTIAPPGTAAPASAPISGGTPPPTVSVKPTASTVPVVDVANLPRPRDGVVTGSPGHRLWIDGVLEPSWKVTLPCGSHVVQVGSAGAPRTVEVPCGSTVMVSP
jgi:hypothetical protein